MLYGGGYAVANGGSGVVAGLGKLGGAEAAGGGWAAATLLLGGAANTAVGVAAGGLAAICSWALARFLVRIWIWLCMDSMSCSIPEVGRSSRILSILGVAP